MVGLFVVAAVVTVAAAIPTLAMGGGGAGVRSGPRVCFRPMALRTPASSSDRPTGSASASPSRAVAPASSGGPGTISVACIVDGKLQETEGDDAIRHLKTW